MNEFDLATHAQRHWWKYALAVLALYLGSIYTDLGRSRETAFEGWSNVKVSQVRRYETIPALVKVVEAESGFERGVLKEVVEARSRVGGVINIDPAKLASDPALQKQMIEASNSLGGALQRLMMVTENYPNLKSNEGFRRLQDEIAGSNNRVAASLRDANAKTKGYNSALIGPVRQIVASATGYKRMDYYEAPAGQTVMPEVNFGGLKK